MNNEQKGTLLIVLGAVLFIAFAGKFILHLVGLIVALIIINHGLQLKKMPGLLSMIRVWIHQIWKSIP